MSTQRPSLSTLSVRERMELWKQREKAAMNKVLSTPESIASSKAQKRAVAITNRMSTTRMSATMRSSGANRNSFTQRNSMAVMGRASTALQGHMESISEAFITGEAEYPTLGVKLPFLLEFIKSNGGRTNLSTFTVKDVQDRIIKLELAKNASIKATGLTYCDIVAKRTPDHVEPSTWYVSCSENDNFLQVIDAIIYTLNQNLLEEDNQRACVWMNIFSLPLQDAHIYMRNQEWWESKMLKAIESVENFLLVLTPLSSALSLTSPTVWNEVLCCYKTNVKFEIAMTEADSSTYLDRVLGFNGIQHLFKPLESITSKHLFESKQGGADIVIRAVENNLKSLELTSTASAISKGNQSKLDYIAKTLIQSRLIRLYLDSMDEPTEATLQVLNQFQSENFTHFNTNIMDTALVSFGGMFQMCFTSLELRYNIRPNSDFSEAKMESLIHKEIQNIKLCLKHPVSDIRDTAAWTIATLFQYDIFAIPPVHLTDIMTILAENLKDSASSVIAKTCYALHSFCAMLLEASPATVKILNIYIIPRNNDIWDILSTEAATDSLLQYNVCQLLKMIVSKTDLWTHREFVLDTMSRSVLKMHQCFRDEESGSVAMEDVTLLMHMCELIGECVVKLHRSMDYAAGGYLRSIPPAMGVLFLVLEFSKKFKQSTDMMLKDLVEKAQIEALLTISDIADVMSDDPKSDFHVYLDRLLPIMFELIIDIRKAELAMITLSTLGDIIRNLKPAILLRYTQTIMTNVMEAYYGAATRRGLLFAYVNVFADLALQLGGPFTRFITGPNCELMLLLKDYAGVIKTMSPDDASAAFSSLLITCAGILVDLRELGNKEESDSKAYLIDIIVPFVEQMICSDVDLLMCDDLLRDAAGVVGDVAQVFGPVAKPALDRPFLPLLMSRSKRSILAFTTAAWSTKLLEEALSIKLDLNMKDSKN